MEQKNDVPLYQKHPLYINFYKIPLMNSLTKGCPKYLSACLLPSLQHCQFQEEGYWGYYKEVKYYWQAWQTWQQTYCYGSYLDRKMIAHFNSLKMLASKSRATRFVQNFIVALLWLERFRHQSWLVSSSPKGWDPATSNISTR